MGAVAAPVSPGDALAGGGGDPGERAGTSPGRGGAGAVCTREDEVPVGE